VCVCVCVCVDMWAAVQQPRLRVLTDDPSLAIMDHACLGLGLSENSRVEVLCDCLIAYDALRVWVKQWLEATACRRDVGITSVLVASQIVTAEHACMHGAHHRHDSYLESPWYTNPLDHHQQHWHAPGSTARSRKAWHCIQGKNSTQVLTQQWIAAMSF
jgi:hypothetical protein